MRKNFGAKPWTYPQPVFILAAYGEDGTPNAMNAAWGGISDDKELSTVSYTHLLSDYKRVISVADTAVKGKLHFAGSHFVTFDQVMTCS